jgi:sulfate adenylyltransferase subunit 1 (EFTu-like GTPase family)
MMTPPQRVHVGGGQWRVLVCGAAQQGKRTLLARLAGERTMAGALDLPRADRSSAVQFVVADMPGPGRDVPHSITEAAAADVGIFVVDVRCASISQAQRFAFIAALLCLPRVVLAINKMDLVGNAQAAFTAIATTYQALAHELGLARVAAVPVSALCGDNVAEPRASMPWYAGHPLVAHVGSPRMDAAPEAASGAQPPPSTADQFEASIAWFGDAPLLRGRRYLMRVGATNVDATIAPLKYRIGLHMLEHTADD